MKERKNEMSGKFNEKYVVSVDETHMLSIFSGSNIEHPYRFQPYVKLVVPFEEYKHFCKTMVELSVSWLTFDISMYKRALESESKDNLLLRLYYLDLSKSILDEILLAIANNTDGTVICQEFADASIEYLKLGDVSKELMLNPSEDIKKGLESLKKDILLDFNINTLSEHNKLLLNYAIYLRVLSYQPNPKVFSLN